MTWPRVIGVLLLGLAAYQLIRGRYSTSDDYGSSDVVDRNKNPVRYWITVGAEAVLGVLMLVGVINF
jgi:23S rRNA maturation mini-RNase III